MLVKAGHCLLSDLRWGCMGTLQKKELQMCHISWGIRRRWQLLKCWVFAQCYNFDTELQLFSLGWPFGEGQVAIASVVEKPIEHNLASWLTKVLEQSLQTIYFASPTSWASSADEVCLPKYNGKQSA